MNKMSKVTENKQQMEPELDDAHQEQATISVPELKSEEDKLTPTLIAE